MTHLVIINGNLNVRQYIDDILNPVVLPFMNNMGANAVFQDDNAHTHRARIVAQFLQQNRI